jgi:C_GCAxxG_C_C family probable redox protein
MNTDDIAVQKLVEGFNCAQAVLFVSSDDAGLDPVTAVKLASGFGAGMGRKGEVCGALTGGTIALGARYGRGEHDDRAATEQTYAKTRELMERFQSAHGTVICRELLGGCDLSTPEGKQVYTEKELGRTVCQNCVRSVVVSLRDML